MLQAVANPEGSGNFAILDLPVPMEPVLVDLDRPLADQLPGPLYLAAAMKLLGRE